MFTATCRMATATPRSASNGSGRAELAASLVVEHDPVTATLRPAIANAAAQVVRNQVLRLAE
jgi:hypothetical protein